MTMPPTSPLLAHAGRRAFYPLLACPTCHGALALDDAAGALLCASGAHRFPIVEGRPTFLPGVSAAKQNAAVEAQHHMRTGRKRKGLPALADAFRDRTTATIFGDDRVQIPRLVDEILRLPRAEGYLVDVGACEQYYRRDLERLGPVIALDVSVYGATDVVADCHRMPFASNSLGTISAVEVLEHLGRPWEFFSEVARTLAPGGVFFGIAPQYCPTHGFPHDFFRYTRGGLESLAAHAGLEVRHLSPVGGRWGTLLHWYWANWARESPLKRRKGLNLLHHLWFQGVAHVVDKLDAREAHGARHLPQEHNDHVGWCFVMQKPATASGRPSP